MSSSHVRQVPETVAHFDREIKMEGKRQTGKRWRGRGWSEKRKRRRRRGEDDCPDGDSGGQSWPEGHKDLLAGRRNKVIEQFVSLDCFLAT